MTSLDIDSIANNSQMADDRFNDPFFVAEQVYQLWLRWANFELYIINPVIEPISPPLITKPELLESGDYEFVYDIHDYGQKLITSKGQEMYTAGMSMCRLFYTIEKMISLLIERLTSGGIDAKTEVTVAFAGHEIAQRKAFESIINLSHNVIVTNFDPGVWGDRYLQNVKKIAEKGHGYPAKSPRDFYRRTHVGKNQGMRRGG
jgi:hypothetical protein